MNGKRMIGPAFRHQAFGVKTKAYSYSSFLPSRRSRWAQKGRKGARFTDLIHDSRREGNRKVILLSVLGAESGPFHPRKKRSRVCLVCGGTFSKAGLQARIRR